MLGDDSPPCQELRQQSTQLQIYNARTALHQHIGNLSLFEHRLVCDNSVGIMYAGGHISALTFHPSSNSLCVIAAHRHDRTTHNVLKCYKGRAHIQLWTLALQPGKTHCIGVVPHNGNCTWDLKWRPDTFQTSQPSVGTLAAALGDGTAIVATFEDFDLPNPPTGDDPVPNTSLHTLTPKIMTLRAHKKTHQRSPVRVAEWSPDGGRLVLGIANGSIEVYEASSKEQIWPRWCIPAQDSVITGVRWMTSSYLCSVSMSCVLRLRDMRDPVSSLEQNTESLAGSFAMEAVEPTVAVVGTDNGTLRVVKLGSIDGILVKQPVKRIYLQTSTLRDIQAIAETGENNIVPHTLLYTGGSEGIVHECVLPRPIWPNPDTCHLPRTEAKQKMRWTIHRPNLLKPKLPMSLHQTLPESNGHVETCVDNDEVLQLCVGDDSNKTVNSSLIDNNGAASGDATLESENRPKPKRRSRAAGREGVDRDSNLPKTVLFGSELDQRTTITRIGLSQKDDLLAVGMDDGILTWMPMKGGELKSPFIPRSKGPTAGATPKKIKVPGRKRGRPRKYPLPEVKTPENSSSVHGVREKGSEEDVEKGSVELVPTSKKRALPEVKVLGPKTKRSRSKPEDSEDINGQKTFKSAIEDNGPTKRGKKRKNQTEYAENSDVTQRARMLASGFQERSNEKIIGNREDGSDSSNGRWDEPELDNIAKSIQFAEIERDDKVDRSSVRRKKKPRTEKKTTKKKQTIEKHKAKLTRNAYEEKTVYLNGKASAENKVEKPGGENVNQQRTVQLRLRLKKPRLSIDSGQKRPEGIKQHSYQSLEQKPDAVKLRLRLRPSQLGLASNVDKNIRGDNEIDVDHLKVNGHKNKQTVTEEKTSIHIAQGQPILSNENTMDRRLLLRLPLKRKKAAMSLRGNATGDHVNANGDEVERRTRARTDDYMTVKGDQASHESGSNEKAINIGQAGAPAGVLELHTEGSRKKKLPVNTSKEFGNEKLVGESATKRESSRSANEKAIERASKDLDEEQGPVQTRKVEVEKTSASTGASELAQVGSGIVKAKQEVAQTTVETHQSGDKEFSQRRPSRTRRPSWRIRELNGSLR